MKAIELVTVKVPAALARPGARVAPLAILRELLAKVPVPPRVPAFRLKAPVLVLAALLRSNNPVSVLAEVAGARERAGDRHHLAASHFEVC